MNRVRQCLHMGLSTLFFFSRSRRSICFSKDFQCKSVEGFFLKLLVAGSDCLTEMLSKDGFIRGHASHSFYSYKKPSWWNLSSFGGLCAVDWFSVCFWESVHPWRDSRFQPGETLEAHALHDREELSLSVLIRSLTDGKRVSSRTHVKRVFLPEMLGILKD